MGILQKLNVKNKHILVRCDFNVPLDQGRILDDFRIQQTLPTIQYLLERDAKVILLSHLGRPPTRYGSRYSSRYLSQYSLAPVARRLGRLLKQPVSLTGLPIELSTRSRAVSPLGAVVLLENLRFHRGEEANDLNFARGLAKLGDIYINDAFSVCHRKHASVVSLPQLLPSAAGLLLQSEVKTLCQIIEKPKRPLVAILGGAKIETKLGLIKKFLDLSDHLLLGGKIANTLCLKPALKQIELTNPKLHLPLDGLIALKSLEGGYQRTDSMGNARRGESVFDIGPQTVKMFSDIIKTAKTVFWSGPLGYIEDEKFIQGSLAIAEAIIRSRAFSVVGGGDTDAFLGKHRLRERFSYVSTGGGAMLEFLSGDKLPGLEALNYGGN